MRLLHLYLIAYFVLVFGAGLALWQAGVVARLPGSWLALAALITIGLGVVLTLTSSSRPPLVRD